MRSTWRRLPALTLMLAASLFAAACGGGEESSDAGGDTAAQEGVAAGRTGGEASMTLTSFPDYLDPALSYTQEGWQSLWTVYTPLLSYAHAEGAEGSELIPGLAEAMPEISEDGRTYTLTLRDGLTYSDGTEVQASDFEHTIKRVLNLESGGSSFYLGIVGAENYLERGRANGDIEGIRANDETGEITIELEEADGAFPYVLAMDFAGLVPGDTPFENLTTDPPPGVGPFMYENVRQNRSYDLVRNPEFPDIEGIPAAKLDRISAEIVENETRQVQDVIQNRVDYMLDAPPPDQLREVREQYGDRFEVYTTNSTYYFFMNHRTPPFDDVQVRQAVNFAIDSRALARLFGGLLAPGCNFLPPGMHGYEEISPCPYGDPAGEPDLERAQQLIAEAGAEGEQVTVYGNQDPPSPAITEYLADTLNRIGLDAEPRLLDGSVYFQTIGNQRTEAQIGFTNWFQDFPHPANFMFLVDPASIQSTNNQNFGNVEDPEIAQMLEEAKPLPIEESAGIYAQVDRRLIEQAHVAPYGHAQLTNFVSERVDFENCTVTHPVYQLDLTQLCLVPE